MDPLTISMLIGGGANLLKGIFGAAQGIGGAQRQKELWQNRPQLGITEGERANDSLYKQMASATEMPGQKQAESKLDRAVAEGVYGAQQGAVSSLGAQQASVDLAAKKIAAVSDLAGQFAEFKAQRQDALGAWNRQKTELEQQRWNVNEYEPWNIKMNEAVAAKQAGMQAFGQGVSGAGAAYSDFAGTNQYLKILQAMQK